MIFSIDFYSDEMERNLRIDFDVKVKRNEWSVDYKNIEVYDAFYDRTHNLFGPVFTIAERRQIMKLINEKAEAEAGNIEEEKAAAMGEAIYERIKQEG